MYSRFDVVHINRVKLVLFCRFQRVKTLIGVFWAEGAYYQILLNRMRRNFTVVPERCPNNTSSVACNQTAETLPPVL